MSETDQPREPFREPTTKTLSEEDLANLQKPYEGLLHASEWWIIVGRGAFAFRFGPYTGKECGPILERSVRERIAVTVVGVCGREFDWEMARDMGLKMILKGDPGWKAEDAEPKPEPKP